MASDSGFGRVVSELAKVVGELSRVVSTIGKAATASGSPASSPGKPPTAIAIGVAVNAIRSVTDALLSIPGAVSKFVSAFDPGKVELLSATFDQLSATLGYIFTPIIEATTEIVRAFTAEIAAVAGQLRPVVSQIAQMFVTTLKPVIAFFGDALSTFAVVLKSLTPVIQLVLTFFEGFASIASVLMNITASLFSTFDGFGNLKNTIEAVKEAFVNLAIFIIKIADSFLRLAGFSDLANRMLDGLGRKRPTDVIKAAPKDIGIASLQDIYKQRLEAAAKGMTGPSEQEKTNNILERIAKEMERMREEARNDPGAGRRFAQGVQSTVESVSPRAWSFFEFLGESALNMAGRTVEPRRG